MHGEDKERFGVGIESADIYGRPFFAVRAFDLFDAIGGVDFKPEARPEHGVFRKLAFFGDAVPDFGAIEIIRADNFHADAAFHNLEGGGEVVDGGSREHVFAIFSDDVFNVQIAHNLSGHKLLEF